MGGGTVFGGFPPLFRFASAIDRFECHRDGRTHCSLKETPTENAYDEITVRWGLLFISVVFTILSFRVSSAAGFQWGLYQNARNIVINASEVLEAKKENVQQDYETRMLWKPVTENRKGRRHWYGFTWGFFNRIPNYLFWPLLNFLAPILAIIVLL